MFQRLTVGLICLLACASSAAAQATRADWIDARDKKDRRVEQVHRLARGSTSDDESVASTSEGVSPQAVTGVLSFLSFRSFPDAFGDMVVVGEVQNNSGATLSFSKAIVDFYNGAVYVGSDYNYVFGSHNGRLALTGSYVPVLPPGAIGFFKVWTNLPYNGITSLFFRSEAETYTLAPVFSTLQLGSISLAPDGFGGTNFAGTVRNATGSFTTFFTLIALAGSSGGWINDVDFTYASGATVNLCGTSSTSVVGPGVTAPYSGFFLRTVSAISRAAVEWDEYGIMPAAQGFDAAGGAATVSVVGNCAWNAISNAPWITITSAPGGTGDGSLSFAVAANTGPARTGTLTIAGHTFTVSQASGVVCAYSVVSSVTSVLGTGALWAASVTAPTGCPWSASSSAPWLTITSGATGSGNGTVGLSAAANLTNQSRVGTITIAGQTFTVTQEPILAPRTGSIDFDGDNKADIGVFRRSTGDWFVIKSGNSALLQVGWGVPALLDTPVPGDYDGDGRADVAVFRSSTGEWFIIRSSNSQLLQVAWGVPALGDMPVPADYDNDGRTDIAVYRTTTGEWFIIKSTNSQLLQVAWGTPALGDLPVVGDYDGDGRADVAVYRLSTGEWFVIRSSTSTLLHVAWGVPALGDLPVVGDYDADGKSDVAVYRQTTGEWFVIRSSNSTLLQVAWGVPALGDIPVQADYDGDGRIDVAVYRRSNGNWFIIRSTDSTLLEVTWGVTALGDAPVSYP